MKDYLLLNMIKLGIFMFTIIIVISLFFNSTYDNVKYIKDNKNGVTWIITNKGDTIGTVQ